MQIIPHSSSIFVSTNQYELLLDELKARLPGLEDSIQCIAQETAERKREREREREREMRSSLSIIHTLRI